jgi:RHS repeat-associated protein
VVTIIPHEANNIDLNLDLLALDLTNDPNPVRFDGVPPEYEAKKIMVASLIDLPGLLVQSIVGQIPGETVYYYVNDHLGTPQKMMDETGAVVWSADYKPFGKADVTVNTVENNFRFPGQHLDEETGLHYNWHRYYCSGIGRYFRPDPILQLMIIDPSRGRGYLSAVLSFAETPQKPNIYVYAINNSVNLTDPSGLGPPSECEFYADLRSECDNYACLAYEVCKRAGDNNWSNCVRNCLIDKYKQCKTLWCITRDHAKCISVCSYQMF